jgi:hypothetical protein
MRKLFKGLVLTVLASSAANAQPKDVFRATIKGAVLYQFCKNDEPYCTGYVAAVADALAPLSESGALPASSPNAFCLSNFDVRQAILTFEKYAEGHPEQLQINAAQLVGNILHDSFPCLRK